MTLGWVDIAALSPKAKGNPLPLHGAELNQSRQSQPALEKERQEDQEFLTILLTEFEASLVYKS